MAFEIGLCLAIPVVEASYLLSVVNEISILVMELKSIIDFFNSFKASQLTLS